MNRMRWRLKVFISRWRNRVRYLLAAPRVYRNWWAWPLPKLFHRNGQWTEERLAAWLGDRGYEVRHTRAGWNGLLWATRNQMARADGK